MHRKLIWATAATTIFVLVPGLVVLEGTMKPATDHDVSVDQSPTPEDAPPVQIVSTETPMVVEVEPVFVDEEVWSPEEDVSGPDVSAILEAPIEQLILGDAYRGPDGTETEATAAESADTEASGELADDAEFALAEMDIGTLLASEFFGSSDSGADAPSAGSETPDDSPEEATVPDGSEMETAAKTENAGNAKPDKVEEKDVEEKNAEAKEKQPDAEKEKEDDEDQHDRIKISLIRPKGDAVRSQDEVIVRSRAKALKRAFVMVRARQKDAPWWVQDEAIRNGDYFRARAQFGNGKTLDGTRFRMVIAFVTEKDEVPEAGVFFDEIPLKYVLSQEFDVTLNR